MTVVNWARAELDVIHTISAAASRCANGQAMFVVRRMILFAITTEWVETRTILFHQQTCPHNGRGAGSLIVTCACQIHKEEMGRSESRELRVKSQEPDGAKALGGARWAANGRGAVGVYPQKNRQPQVTEDR